MHGERTISIIVRNIYVLVLLACITRVSTSAHSNLILYEVDSGCMYTHARASYDLSYPFRPHFIRLAFILDHCPRQRCTCQLRKQKAVITFPFVQVGREESVCVCRYINRFWTPPILKKTRPTGYLSWTEGYRSKNRF